MRGVALPVHLGDDPTMSFARPRQGLGDPRSTPRGARQARALPCPENQPYGVEGTTMKPAKSSMIPRPPRDVYDWKDRIARAEDIRDVYDAEAAHYDRVIRENSGYVIPDRTIDLLLPLVSPEARILDAGSGTGIVGEQLHRAGFRELVALDSSAGMLEQARQKDVYRSLIHAVAGQALPLDSASFQAVIAVGLFGPTHAPPEALDELLRVTVGGGHVVFSMSVDECAPGSAFARKVESLEDSLRWQLVAESDPFRGFETLDTERLFVARAYQRM